MKRSNVKYQKGGYSTVGGKIEFNYEGGDYECLLVDENKTLFVGDTIKFKLETEPTSIDHSGGRGQLFEHDGTIKEEYKVIVSYPELGIEDTPIDLEHNSLTIIEHNPSGPGRPKNENGDTVRDKYLKPSIDAALKAKAAALAAFLEEYDDNEEEAF